MTDEEKFIESLYDEANEDLKEVYNKQKESRDELLKEIAIIMLTYNILDGFMSIKKNDKDKIYINLSRLIVIHYKNITNKEVKVLNNILESTVKKTFKFYSYNADFKDIRKIVESNFKGKHFSERIWSNEEEIAKYLHKQINDFLNGKINVNQIKKDIEKTFNTSAYNSRRLVETEVNRCEDEAFRRFCKEVGAKKVVRNEVLDRRTCEECASIDGKVYELDDAPGVVHPCCRGFNTIYK